MNLDSYYERWIQSWHVGFFLVDNMGKSRIRVQFHGNLGWVSSKGDIDWEVGMSLPQQARSRQGRRVRPQSVMEKRDLRQPFHDRVHYRMEMLIEYGGHAFRFSGNTTWEKWG